GRPAGTVVALHRRRRRPEPADGLIRRGDLKPAYALRPGSRLRDRTRLRARKGIVAGDREHRASFEARSEGKTGAGLRRRRAGLAPQNARDNARLRAGKTAGSRRRACRLGKISDAQQQENFALWQETITASGKPLREMANRARPDRKPRKRTGAGRAKRRRPAPCSSSAAPKTGRTRKSF